MSDSWNVPSRKSSCSISMLTEKINATFPLCHRIFFQLLPTFFSNVHITTELNGTIMITFSMHSVVSFRSPFTVSQMLQPPMTSDNGFNHRFRFNRVLKTNDTWYGMTYHEDVVAVKDSFKKMLENGVYKADLFSDL